jgi:uncharacterized protein YgiM (DUF1202 family)
MYLSDYRYCNDEAGTEVQVVEEDDGSGWVKVSDGRKSGLVPASYLSMDESSTSSTAAITPQARPQGAKKKGEQSISMLSYPFGRLTS